MYDPRHLDSIEASCTFPAASLASNSPPDLAVDLAFSHRRRRLLAELGTGPFLEGLEAVVGSQVVVEILAGVVGSPQALEASLVGRRLLVSRMVAGCLSSPLS